MGNPWMRSGNLSKILLETEAALIPHKTITTNPNQSKPRKRNLDDKCPKVIKRKHRLWTRYLESRDGQRYLEYCQTRNKVRSMTRKIAKQKEREIANEAKSNPKKFWNYINQKLNTKIGIPNVNYRDGDGNHKVAVSDNENAEILVYVNTFTDTCDAPPNLVQLGLQFPMTDSLYRENSEILKSADQSLCSFFMY